MDTNSILSPLTDDNYDDLFGMLVLEQDDMVKRVKLAQKGHLQAMLDLACDYAFGRIGLTDNQPDYKTACVMLLHLCSASNMIYDTINDFNPTQHGWIGLPDECIKKLDADLLDLYEKSKDNNSESKQLLMDL